jgi:hypothetical protein
MALDNAKVTKFHEKLIDKVSEEQDKLIYVLIEKAKKGDTALLKELLERVLGKVKEDLTIHANHTHELILPPERMKAIMAVYAANKGIPAAVVDVTTDTAEDTTND